MRVSAFHEMDTDGNGIYDTATLTEYLNDPSNHTGYSQVLKVTEYSIDNETRTVAKEIFYTIGLDQISQTLSDSEGTTTHFFTFDGHGSTRVLLDAGFAIAQIYSYDAYGNAIGFNPKDALTEYLYSGEQFDSKIGQQYLRSRYYDPSTGRFNSFDSFYGNVNDPQSLHKYLYTQGDPVNMTDPSGMFGICGISISLSIGQVMNGMQSLGSATAHRFACGTVSGALVGSIMGALVTAIQQLDSVVIHKKKFLKSLQWGIPDDKDARNLVKRLLEYEAEYFRFIPAGIPPTNNPAEQTIRKVVIDRKVTQGTRSDWGNRWLERFWSIQATCEQQRRSLLDYMTETLEHYLRGTATPPLILS